MPGSQGWDRETSLRTRKAQSLRSVDAAADLKQRGPELTSESGRFHRAKMHYIIYSICIIAFHVVSHSFVANQYILLLFKQK